MTFFFLGNFEHKNFKRKKIPHHHVNFIDIFELYYILTLGVQFRYLDHSPLGMVFNSSNNYYRHNQVSDLHKSNLEAWHRENATAQPSAASIAASLAASSGGGRYRDRAKERRQKYGNDDEGPKPNRLKEKYLQAVEEAEMSGNSSSSSSKGHHGGSKSSATSASTSNNGGGGGREKAIDGSNIGSKMLQKMGWKEGLGLGKKNQGRTTIIEVKLFFV